MHKPFISFPLDLDAVLALVSLQLVAYGLYVAPSFEVSSSCASFTQEICPHLGEGPCECRLKVLPVYDKQLNSLHLIVHEFGGKTEFFFGKEIDFNHPELESRVKEALQEESSIILSFIET